MQIGEKSIESRSQTCQLDLRERRSSLHNRDGVYIRTDDVRTEANRLVQGRAASHHWVEHS